MEKDENKYTIFPFEGARYKTILTQKFLNRTPYQPENPLLVTAQIPGTILKVQVKVGQKVTPSRSMLILEAMKMKNRIFSETGGVVKTIHVKEGDIVSKNQLLIEFEDKAAKVSSAKEKKSRKTGTRSRAASKSKTTAKSKTVATSETAVKSKTAAKEKNSTRSKNTAKSRSTKAKKS